MKKEQTLRDLIVLLLRRANLILLCAVVVAVLGAGYGAYQAFQKIRTEDIQSAAKQEELTKLMTDREYIQRKFDITQRTRDYLNQYINSSPWSYFDYDEINQSSCIIRTVINGKYNNQNLYEQQAAQLKSAVEAAASAVRTDEEVHQKLLALFDDQFSLEHLYDLIEIKAALDIYTPNDINIYTLNDFDIYTLKVAVCHTDTLIAEQMLGILTDHIRNMIQDLYPECTVQVLSRGTVRMTSEELFEDTGSFRLLQNFFQEIEIKNSQLDIWQQQLDQVNNRIYSLQSIFPSDYIIKFGLLGFAGGMVIAVFWLLFVELTNQKIRSRADLSDHPHLHFLGSITPPDSKWTNPAATLLLRWMGAEDDNNQMTVDELIRLAGATISFIAEKAEPPIHMLAYASTGQLSSCQPALETLQTQIGISSVIAGNVLQDSDSLQQLRCVDSVVLIERCGKCLSADLERMLEKMDQAKLTVMGILLY